jgi:hypothetical protein
MFARIRPLMLTLLAVLTASPVLAASHREAPLIAKRPISPTFISSGAGRIPTKRFCS